MSQFGMQLPGSQAQRRTPQMNVYTGLALLAVVCLGAAVAIMWREAASISGGEGAMPPVTTPFVLQERGNIRIAD